MVILLIGFPSESEQDFQDSLDCLQKYKFPILHISQFYPRPGTPAAKMPRIDTKIVKDRSRRATTLFNSYGGDESLLGKEINILVTELSADNNHFVGHDKCYRQVLVPNDPKFMGKHLKVRVLEVSKWSMVGEVIECDDDLNFVPRLVRQGKQILNIGEGKGDGSVMSGNNDLGKDSSNLLKYTAGGLVLATLLLPVRTSLKATLCILTGTYYYYSTNK